MPMSCRRAARLAAVAHMGSSVKRFLSDGIWERGIHVTSAGITLARDVAETTLGLMIVGRKRIWPLGRHVRDGGWRDRPVLGPLGCPGADPVDGRADWSEQRGPSGHRAARSLRDRDPSQRPIRRRANRGRARRSARRGRRPGRASRHRVPFTARPTSRRTTSSTAAGWRSWRDGTVLINTARGELVDEDALVDELETGRIFAFPGCDRPRASRTRQPASSARQCRGHPPHIAGCIENCHRMGELAVEELRRHFAGEPAVYEIRREMLDRIA